MALCIPISPTSSASSYSTSASSLQSPSTSPALSNSSAPSSPKIATMPLPPLKQSPSTAPSSPYGQRQTPIYQAGSHSHSALDLRHLNNGSTSTLNPTVVESRHSTETPRASHYPTRRSRSPRFSSLSIKDTINEKDLRSSTFSTLSLGSLTCHPEFWFSDGSIILSVQTTLFKVHKSTLATHSEMFADMFHMDQQLNSSYTGGEDDEWFDGCRVVKLFDDSAEDWVDLLSAIYKPHHFDDVPTRQFQIRHTPVAPSILNSTATTRQKPFNLSVALDFTSGILRLSHKYLISHLRSRCLALLAPFFPSSFEDFAISMPLLNPQFSSTGSASPHKKRDRDSGPLMTRTSTLLRAINLFHAVDASHFLPYAYYCLSKLPSKKILQTRDLDPSDPRKSDLSWREKAFIVHGKDQLRLAAMNDTMSCLGAFQRSVGCTSEYEVNGGINGPVYNPQATFKECDYAARVAWDSILRGDVKFSLESGAVNGGGGATANAGWASTASLLTLSLNAPAPASAPPMASASSSGSGISTTPDALNSVNFSSSSSSESIHLTDPLAPFLSWDHIGRSSSRYAVPSSVYTPYPALYHSYHAIPNQQPMYKVSGEPVMCYACLNKCQVQHYSARKRVWEALPQIFGLGTWDELTQRAML